jgi:indolepyruvate ferredoxin oxidoreductase alpha subunit
MIWPLPIDKIKEFAASVKRLVVIEELDPVIETELKAAALSAKVSRFLHFKENILLR